jgi:hypothetical protein
MKIESPSNRIETPSQAPSAQDASGSILQNLIIVTVTALVVLVASNVALGQKTASKTGGMESKAMMAPPNLDQCSNGSPNNAPLACTGSQWQNGNLNSINSQWVEGQAVPYRLTLTGQTVGVPATYRLQWDTTISGKHAIDYLMSFDASATGDPCSGIATCVTSSVQTFDIPEDFRAKAGQDGIVGTADDIVQKPGVFSVYGGVMTSVSNYMLSGTYAGSSSTAIDVTIIPQQATVVIAWGGHIATRMDWGTANSAINLTGSPYHMRSLTGGNQDRSLSLDAIIFPGKITVIKEVFGAGGATSSESVFSYTATNFGTNGFALVDADLVGPDRKSKDIVLKTASTTVTIQELDTTGWTLSEVKCTSESGGLPITDNNSISGNTISIVLEEAEIVTCTSRSSQLGVLSANVSLAGLVSTPAGIGIRGATVTAFNTTTFETYVAKTNNFGFYKVEGLPAGDFYIVTVSHPRYYFPYSMQALTVDDVMEGLNFVSR